MAEQTQAVENDDDPSDDIQRVVSELGGNTEGITIRLLRLDKAGARTGAFLADMDPSEFSFAEVKARFGGGHYRAKLTEANGRLMRNQAFSIEGKPRSPEEAQPVQATQAQTPSGAADPSIAILNMQMSMMQAQTKQHQDFMREFLTIMRQTPAAPPQPAFGPQEMIGLISAMMPLFANKAAPATDPMAPFLKGLELGRDLGGAAGGSGGDDDSALGILSKGLDALGPLVSRIASAPPAPAATIPARRVQRPAPPEARTDPAISMSAEQKEIYSMMKMLAGAALSSAVAGEEPAAMVANYGSLVPAAYRAALTDPKIVDALVKVEPALEPHRGWLDRLREAFRESYTGPLDRAADSGVKVDYGPPAS